MKRRSKAFLCLALSAAMVFSGVNPSALAAEGARTAGEKAPETPVESALSQVGGVPGTVTEGSGDGADNAIEEAAEAAEDAADIEASETLRGEDEVSDDAGNKARTWGISYMQPGEASIDITGETEEVDDESLVTDNYLVDSNGARVAAYGSHEYNFPDVWTSFHLSKSIKTGKYNAVIKTRDGIEHKYSELVVTDRPTVVSVRYSGDSGDYSGYDNSGDHIHLVVEGVNLGDGEAAAPLLKHDGVTVARTEEVFREGGRNYPTYIYKLKKDKSAAAWDGSMQLTPEFDASVTNAAAGEVIDWYPSDVSSEPFEHVYYDAYQEKTIFRFKPGMNIPGNADVSITLYDYDFDTDTSTKAAEGSGKTDDKGQAAITFRDGFIPVEKTKSSGGFKAYEADVFINSEKKSNKAFLWIYRYDAEASSDEGLEIKHPSDLIYADDKSFNPVFEIDDSLLSGSGDLTAVIEGHTGKLTSEGGNRYSGEIGLGSGLGEGDYDITVSKGNKVVGKDSVHVIKQDVFYQDYQKSAWWDHSKKQAYVEFNSNDIIKEYYDQRETEKIAEKIWTEKKLKLEVFTPEGNAIEHGDMVCVFDGEYYCVYFTLPDEVEDYYGFYTRITSDGKLGLRDKSESLYHYWNVKRGDSWTEKYGEYYEAYRGELGTLDVLNRYDDKLECIVANGINIAYPITVEFVRRNTMTPLKRLKIEKADMKRWDAMWAYLFTEEDLEGISATEPYEVVISDEDFSIGSEFGYVDVFKGELPPVKKVVICGNTDDMAVGETRELSYIYTPASDLVLNADWTSSDETVATVEDGKVTGVGEGTVNITVTAGGKSDTVSVNVIKDPVPLTALTLSQNSLRLEPGESKAVGVIKTPEDTTDKITFTSSDPAVASVDEAGVVTAKKIGSTTITAEGGSKERLEAKCEVKVVKEFKLQRDNNHFANAKLNFFKTAEGNTYQFRSDEYLDRLKKLASGSFDEAVVANAIIDGWGGSCFGIAATMGLIQTGRLSLSDLTDSSAADYHSLSAPVNDDKLFDSINFYQTGQRMTTMRNSSDMVRIFKTDADEDSSRLTAFLKRLVESTADDKPVIFGYSFKKDDGEASGHAILAVNSRKDEDNHRYIVTLYDENTANGHQGQETEGYTEMIIPEDYSSFDYTPVGMSFKLQDRYDYLEICYPESLPLFIDDDTVSNTGKLANGADDGVIISVPLKSDITLKNDQGQNVSIKQGEAGGDMPVRDLKYIFADDASRVQVQVDKSDNFTVSSDNMDLSLITGEKIMSLKGEGMDSANLSLKDDKVSISGNNYKFNVTISCKNSDSLISMDGTAAGDTTVSVEGDTMTASSTGGLADLTSTSYTGNESQKEKVKVAEDGKGASAKHTETISGSGMDPEAEVNADNELCLVKGQTARLNGAGWKISGSSKAISLSAKNGVTTITSKQASTEGVSITDGKETYKVYVSVPSAKINGNKSAKLVAGSTAEVKISGIPGSLLDKYNVAWTSAKTEVAVVAPSSGSTAVVTAVGKGSTNITAYVGGKAYNCKVTVTDDAKNIPKTAGASADLTLNPMQTVSLKYSSFTAKDAVWSSMDSLSMNTVEKDKKGNPTASGNGIIKIVNKNGKITAIGEGETTVKGTDKTGRTVILKITVKPLPANPVAYVRCGKAVTLKASKLNKKYTEWKVESGKEFVQELNNGKVKAVSSLPSSPASECAEVLCKFKPYVYGKGFEYRYRVYVEDPSLMTSDKGLSAGTKKGQYSLNLKKGEAFSLMDQYKGISRGVIWKSSKPSVAYIDENGVIHATRSGNAGSTNLTASVGGVALKVTVRVTE